MYNKLFATIADDLVTLSEWISGVADLRRVLITQSCLEDTISFTAVSVFVLSQDTVRVPSDSYPP